MLVEDLSYFNLKDFCEVESIPLPTSNIKYFIKENLLLLFNCLGELSIDNETEIREYTKGIYKDNYFMKDKSYFIEHDIVTDNLILYKVLDK